MNEVDLSLLSLDMSSHTTKQGSHIFQQMLRLQGVHLLASHGSLQLSLRESQGIYL